VGVEMQKLVKGYSIVELMIIVFVVSILAAIAYPSYQGTIRKTRRQEAISAIMTAAQEMERYRTIYNSYVNVTLASAPRPVLYAVPASLSEYYTFEISSTAPAFTAMAANATSQQYQIRIQAKGPQLKDTALCHVLTYDFTQKKGPTAAVVNACW
jgi:type IV pilus assembly protein PilE